MNRVEWDEGRDFVSMDKVKGGLAIYKGLDP